MLILRNRASSILYDLAHRPGTWAVPANVCPVVIATLLKAGRPFELVDVSPDDLCPGEPPAGVDVVLFVRPYGMLDDRRAWFTRLKQRGLFVIDDRCLGVPEFEPDTQGADLVLYSTGPTKTVELGYGGFAFYEGSLEHRTEPFDPRAHERLTDELRAYIAEGRVWRYQDSPWLDTGTPELGPKEYRAAVEALIPRALAHKRALNALYQGLPGALPASYQNWRFNLRVDDKAACLERIFAAGLFASSHYSSMATLLGRPPAPVAEALHGRVVNLFNNERFTPAMARRMRELWPPG